MDFNEACRVYLHRFTMEHVPRWAETPAPNGRYYAPQYASDREWFDNTKFPPENPMGPKVTDCYSANPTWPCGQWLAEPYKKGEPAVPFATDTPGMGM